MDALVTDGDYYMEMQQPDPMVSFGYCWVN